MIPIESAERAVLCALFRAYPKALVWIGGSVLHLLHGSPRWSYDLDLCPREHLPPKGEAVAIARSALEEVNQALGSRFALAPQPFPQWTVLESGTPAFQVDFTRITGRIAETTAVVLESLLGPQAVVVPTDAALLLLKLEALMFRPFVKPADVFDIWFLVSRGVRLTRQQRRWLSEQVRLREIERADAEGRVRRLAPERLLAELRKRLPAEAFHGWNAASVKRVIDTALALLRKEIRWG